MSALTIMAWREILARAMAGFEVQENVSPDWLINPATRRRLKLDAWYPEAGLALRFTGLTAKGQRRQSDWELLEDEQRNQTRVELCRLNGVELVLLDLHSPDPRRQLQELRTVLSRLSRQLAQGSRPPREKAGLMPRLTEARHRLDDVIRQVRRPENMALYAELWRDREAAAVTATRQPAGPNGKPRPASLPQLKTGQIVEHARFGPGEVIHVGPGDDPQLTIQFEDGTERTFLGSLVANKLHVV